MIINSRFIFWSFIGIILFLFSFFAYFLFFYDSSESNIENLLKGVGFDSADGGEDSPATPLPDNPITGFGVSENSDGFGGGNGGSGQGGEISSSGEGNSGSSNSIMHFCTFEADRKVNNAIPCRCGLSAVCTEEGMICDATFSEGQGICESEE